MGSFSSNQPGLLYQEVACCSVNCNQPPLKNPSTSHPGRAPRCRDVHRQGRAYREGKVCNLSMSNSVEIWGCLKNYIMSTQRMLQSFAWNPLEFHLPYHFSDTSEKNVSSNTSLELGNQSAPPWTAASMVIEVSQFLKNWTRMQPILGSVSGGEKSTPLIYRELGSYCNSRVHRSG